MMPMRRSALLLALVALPFLVSPAPAGALADVCGAAAAGGAGTSLVPTTHVPGTLSHLGPGACGLGAHFFSVAAPCPTGYVGALPGVFCGPLVAPGASARCAWDPFLGGPSFLVVGFDLPAGPIGYDGNLNLTGGESVLYAGSDLGTFTVSNPSSQVGKLMAYPANGGAGFSPEDVTLVSCVAP